MKNMTLLVVTTGGVDPRGTGDRLNRYARFNIDIALLRPYEGLILFPSLILAYFSGGEVFCDKR